MGRKYDTVLLTCSFFQNQNKMIFYLQNTLSLLKQIITSQTFVIEAVETGI